MKIGSPCLCIKGCWKQKTDELTMSENGKRTIQDEGNSLLQVLATISSCLSLTGSGSIIGWSSPSIPYLKSNESKISITVEEGAWITSAASLGSILGCIFVTLLINRVGRKYTILLFAICQIISWITIIYSSSFAALCIARIIMGISSSGSIIGVTIYVGEIAEKKIRGMLSAFTVIFSDLGIFIVASMGAYLSYNVMNLALLFIPLLHVVTFIFMPESPYFYQMQGRDKETVESLMRLRGFKSAKTVQFQVEQIKVALDEKQKSEKSSLQHLFFKKSNLKGFAIVIVAVVASMSSGSLAMFAYAQEIFSYSGFLLTPSHSFMVLIGAKIIAGLFFTQLIERFGRRILFLVSGNFCALFLAIVGVFFFCKYYLVIDVSSMSWLPLMSLISFQITAAMGLGPIPFVLAGEFFAIEVKQLALPGIIIACSLITFGTELMFPFVNKSAGIYTSFWIFATNCFVGSVSVFISLPETKGKSLESIQSLLRTKNKQILEHK